HGQGFAQIRRDRRLGVRAVRRRHAGRRGDAPDLLLLPPAGEGPRLRLHPLRTLMRRPQAERKETMTATASTRRIRLARPSPAYWRVTFDHPPLNIFGPGTIPQLEAVIASLERDPDVKVVVFDSAVEGFFLTHYDFLAKLEESTSLPAGATGLQPLPDML